MKALVILTDAVLDWRFHRILSSNAKNNDSSIILSDYVTELTYAILSVEVSLTDSSNVTPTTVTICEGWDTKGSKGL